MTCAICNDVLQIPVKLECSHIFCTDCIKEWFLRKRICPVCRAPSDKFQEIVSQGVDFDFEAFDDYDLTDSSDASGDTSTDISTDISADTTSSFGSAPDMGWFNEITFAMDRSNQPDRIIFSESTFAMQGPSQLDSVIFSESELDEIIGVDISCTSEFGYQYCATQFDEAELDRLICDDRRCLTDQEFEHIIDELNKY